MLVRLSQPTESPLTTSGSGERTPHVAVMCSFMILVKARRRTGYLVTLPAFAQAAFVLWNRVTQKLQGAAPKPPGSRGSSVEGEAAWKGAGTCYLH